MSPRPETGPAQSAWRALVVHAVAALCPSGSLVLDLDDALYNKSRANIEGAGTFGDAVRSMRDKVVYATGLNLVIVAVRVCPPWGGMPIGVPVGVRLHRKAGRTTELASYVIVELASWLADRSFTLCADGAYASLAGRGLPRTTVTSRMRRDAAPWRRTWDDTAFTKVTVELRGREKHLLVLSRPVLWCSVDKTSLVLLVIVRDPGKLMHDDFFVTTDPGADPGEVTSLDAGRWSRSSASTARWSSASEPRTPSAGRARGLNAPPRCRCGGSSVSSTGMPVATKLPGRRGAQCAHDRTRSWCARRPSRSRWRGPHGGRRRDGNRPRLRGEVSRRHRAHLDRRGGGASARAIRSAAPARCLRRGDSGGPRGRRLVIADRKWPTLGPPASKASS